MLLLEPALRRGPGRCSRPLRLRAQRRRGPHPDVLRRLCCLRACPRGKCGSSMTSKGRLSALPNRSSPSESRKRLRLRRDRHGLRSLRRHRRRGFPAEAEHRPAGDTGPLIHQPITLSVSTGSGSDNALTQSESSLTSSLLGSVQSTNPSPSRCPSRTFERAAKRISRVESSSLSLVASSGCRS